MRPVAICTICKKGVFKTDSYLRNAREWDELSKAQKKKVEHTHMGCYVRPLNNIILNFRV